jgi:polysaccharide biosynthesis protein PslF
MFPPRALFLGSYPPRECGIATFTKDVVDSYNKAFGITSDVVAIDEPGGEMRRYGPEVVARLSEEDRSSYRQVADFINRHPSDLLNVQHEYGLFGGERGEWLMDLLRALEKPVAVTMHTVLPEPDETMLRVTLDPELLRVIHHGVPDVPFTNTDAAKASFGIGQRVLITTFGLISRGKGLEYAIEAMRDVVRRHPETLYLILGATHPVVRRQEGESYRETLQAKIREYGLQYNVQLVDKYMEFDELVSYLSATDIYLTPYLNPDQIVSGTLAYAVGCGKAIVSTPYLYAQELLAHNRGFLCEFRDSKSIAQRMNMLLDDPDLRRATERRAYRFGRQMTWPHVAGEYANVFLELARPEPMTLVSSA